tara:strand:+ start:1289 stop:2710 length:1422 start_codon:yes stop_codon:yes gene_type:complete
MTIVNDRPGAFELGSIILISYQSFDGSGTPKRLDIRNLVQEFSIYESIDGKFLSGDMTLLDATNAIQELPITGFERVEFFFRTPGTTKGFDFSIKSGHPMFVYSLTNRQAVNPRSQIYTLKFISLEAIRDHQTRISKAFTGGVDQMIVDVCKDFLKTKKDILVEETKGNYKLVFPRIKPTQVIENLRKNARSKDYVNSGFHFYETAMGFNFKSYEGLFCKENGSPRKVKAFYSPKIKNTGEDDIYNLQSVEDYSIKSQFNTLENTYNGVYSSRLITHDLFTKTFKEYDFDYNVEYGKQNHLEQDARGGKRDDNGILPYFNYDNGDTFGTKNEGVLHYQSSTTKLHNNYEQPEVEEILQKRISQHIAANNLQIEITVPGTTEINVGDLVHFSLPKYAEASKVDQKDQDKYLTGRYLISAARHHVSTLNKRHTLVLELVKDSFNVSYPDENIELFTNNENDQGEIYSAAQVDKYV